MENLDKVTLETEIPDGPQRIKLKDTRRSITHAFQIGNEKGYITVGLYSDGRPGEVFLKMDKEGSTLSGLADSFAIAMSIALQYGVPLNTFVKKFKYMGFEPSGVTQRPDVRQIATSVLDYVAHWLESKFQ